MKTGLEVFEFGEEDKQTERVDAEFLSKFKNPNLQKSLCQFDKCDIMECDHQGDNSTVATLMVSMDLDDKESNLGQDAAPHLNTLVNGHECHADIDCCRTASSFAEQEERIPCVEVPSPGKVQPNGSHPNSPFNSGARSIDVVADDIAESDPSSVAPAIAMEFAVTTGVPSTNCIGSLKMDKAEICIAVDYVFYQKKYSTGCTVVFSGNHIKISGLATSEEDQETHSLQKGIDDVVLIDSERLERFETVSVKLHILSKNAGQIDGTLGVEELEFVVGEPDWSAIWRQITSLNEKYMSLWTVHDTDYLDGVDSLQRKKYFPNFERSFEDVIYPEGDCDAVSISKRDVDLLEPETFINDTIIDFYIQYLKNQILPEEKHRYHFFNSFFFRKLADLDKDPSSALDGRAAFLRVRKWTRKVDIFGKDYIFIPVNFGLHWSLLVICHPGEVASFTDGGSEYSLRLPCILHMDSIKGTHAGLKNLVQSYLWEEWKQRQEETTEDVSFKFMNLRFVPLELPQQENSFDCGLFLLHYLEMFLSEAPANFNIFNINKFSKFLNWDWFHPVEASLKRTLIQKLISELLENRSKVVTSGDGGGEEQVNSSDGCKESAVEFVARKYSPSIGGHGISSSFQAAQRIEMTLLETSSMKTSECVGDPSMMLRELFEPRVAAGSLLAQCSSFDQSSSYYQLNGAAGPIEGDADNGFMDFGSGDAVFQQMDGMPSNADFPSSFSLQGFSSGASWNAGASAMEDAEGSSSESLSSDTDDSEIGIIENCSLANGDVHLKDKIFEQTSPSLDDNECLTDSHTSTSTDILETHRDIEGAEACAAWDSYESRELAAGEESRTTASMIAELPPEQNATSNELEWDSTEKKETGDDEATALDDGERLESDSKRDETEPGLVEAAGGKMQFEPNSKRDLVDVDSLEAEQGVAAGDVSKRPRLSTDEMEA